MKNVIGLAIFSIITLLFYLTLTVLVDWNIGVIVMISLAAGIIGEIAYYRMKGK